MSKSRNCCCFPFFCRKEHPSPSLTDEIGLEVLEDDNHHDIEFRQIYQRISLDKKDCPHWVKMTETILPEALNDELYKTKQTDKSKNALIINLKMYLGLTKSSKNDNIEIIQFKDDLEIWKAEHFITFLSVWYKSHKEFKHKFAKIHSNVFIPMLSVIDDVREKRKARRLYTTTSKGSLTEEGKAMEKKHTETIEQEMTRQYYLS